MAGSTATTSTAWNHSSAWWSDAKGGETGVPRGYRPCAARMSGKALRSGSWDAGGCDLELVEGCLCRSFRMTSPSARVSATRTPSSHKCPHLASDPVLYRIEYARWPQGLSAHAFRPGKRLHRGDLESKARGNLISTQMYLPGLSPRPDVAQLLQSPGPSTSKPCSGRARLRTRSSGP